MSRLFVYRPFVIVALRRVLHLKMVTQCAMLEDFGIFLVLADKVRGFRQLSGTHLLYVLLPVAVCLPYRGISPFAKLATRWRQSNTSEVERY